MCYDPCGAYKSLEAKMPICIGWKCDDFCVKVGTYYIIYPNEDLPKFLATCFMI